MYEVIRNIGANGTFAPGVNGVGGVAGYAIVRVPSGPQGIPAAQDLGWGPLSGGFFTAGETIDCAPLARSATFATALVHTRSGVASNQTITINQLRAGTVIATQTFVLHPADRDVTVTLSGGALAGLQGDVFQLVMPTPADTQLIDLSVTLRSA